MSINPDHLKDFPMPDRAVATGQYEGYIWVTAKAPIYGINGYVRIPDDELANHPWTKEEYIYEPDDSDLYWSEVTYQSGNWFGFDTLHSFNDWNEEYLWAGDIEHWKHVFEVLRNEQSITMTPELVEHMTRGFAQQASEAYRHDAAVDTHEI